MSLLSKLIKNKFGSKEYDVTKDPIAKELVKHILKYGYDKVFEPLSSDDLVKLITIIDIEIKRRNSKSL
jgi:hypothetical protein